MAKGQERSNREIRKPKQAMVKAPLTSGSTSAFGSQTKFAAKTARGGR